MFKGFWKKVIQFGWLGAPTIVLPFLLEELEIEWIIDYGGSWMKIMSKSLLISKKESVRTLFFQTFWEKILNFFKIIIFHYSWLGKLICSCSHKAPNISLYTTLYCSDASKMSMYLSWLSVCLYSWYIWTSMGKIHPILFLA